MRMLYIKLHRKTLTSRHARIGLVNSITTNTLSRIRKTRVHSCVCHSRSVHSFIDLPRDFEGYYFRSYYALYSAADVISLSLQIIEFTGGQGKLEPSIADPP